jgi:hypothetical protein
MQKVTNLYGVGRLTPLLVDGRGKGAKLKSGVLPEMQKKARRITKKCAYEKATAALCLYVTQQIKATNN